MANVATQQPDGMNGPVSSSNISYTDTITLLTGTTTVAVTATNVLHVCNSGSAFTVNIGAISGAVNGTTLRFKNIGAGIVTLDPNASETIDGQATWSISQYSAVDLVCYNSAWYIR